MTARIMDGTAMADELYGRITEQATAFSRSTGRRSLLATVLVGDDPASHTYVRMKRNRCTQVGIESR